jgi:hypothetical protein
MPYVESPLDRIVGVNFGVVGETSLALSFNATMIQTVGIPQYPADDQFHMTMSTVNLPLFDRTGFAAPPADNAFGTFPNTPSGFIMGSASLGQPEPRGPVTGGANYLSTTATPFNGARSITITLSCTMRAILNASGYKVTALAAGQVKGGANLIEQRLDDTVAAGGTITYTATLNIASSVLSLALS